MKIYVASSWRNPHYPAVITLLRKLGQEVYDFQAEGFRWSEIDAGWESWDVAAYKNALEHPLAKAGFDRDLEGMRWADVCLVVMPCGCSAHLEAGWFCGQSKLCVWWYPDDIELEPELMVKLGHGIVQGIDQLEQALRDRGKPPL